MKIVTFTDLHFGQEKAGTQPQDRLRKALAHVAEHNPNAALIVVTGDLTHQGHAKDYEALRDVLEGAPAPVQLLIGNHDHRETFLSVFPDTPVTSSGHVQAIRDVETHRLIFLDTLQAPPYSYPFSHIGVLCDARLAWLDAQLDTDKPKIIFMHHPPHDTGFVGMDAIKLGNGPAFYDLIHGRGVQHLICGHVHRTISGSHRGLAFSIFKSLVGQTPMLFDVMDFHMECDEPAAYGVLELGPLGIIAHSEDFELTDLSRLRRALADVKGVQ